MKKLRLPVVLLAALMLVAAACGSDSDSDSGDSGSSDTTLPAEVGEGEGALNIVAWPGYIEDGSNDEAYDWVSDFEDETGCQVEVKTAGTSDEMVQLMSNSDEYDLVTASGDASLRLIAGESVQPVNTDLVPNYANVDPRLQDAPWYTVDGANYGVPYQWGADVLMYNTDTFPEAPTSWDVVFEEQDLPDGESNSGRVQAYDGPIYIASAALYLKAHEPDLGIPAPTGRRSAGAARAGGGCRPRARGPRSRSRRPSRCGRTRASAAPSSRDGSARDPRDRWRAP